MRYLSPLIHLPAVPEHEQLQQEQQPVIEAELIRAQPTDVSQEDAHVLSTSTGVVPAAAAASSKDDWKVVVAMSSMLCMICSVDRAAMSVAMGPMGDIFAWSDTTKGAISASFFLGYTLTNLAGGPALPLIRLSNSIGSSIQSDPATAYDYPNAIGGFYGRYTTPLCSSVCRLSKLPWCK